EEIFNYVNFHVLESTAGVEVVSARTIAPTNLVLAANLCRGAAGAPGLELLVHYDAGELHRAQARSYADLVLRTLAAVARDPQAPWTAAPLLRPEQRHQLVTEWNDTTAAEAAQVADTAAPA